MIKIMMNSCAERDFNFINSLIEQSFNFPNTYLPNVRAHNLDF